MFIARQQVLNAERDIATADASVCLSSVGSVSKRMHIVTLVDSPAGTSF